MGLSYNVDGSLIEGNVPLMASLSKLDFAKELKIAFKQLQLVLLQQEHQAHILRAGETESKLGMRSLVLATESSGRNPELKNRLLKTRLSSVSLFGPPPESDESECYNNPWNKLDLKPSVFSPVPSWAGGSKQGGSSKPPRRSSANRGRSGSRRAQQGPHRQVANYQYSQPRASAHQYTQRQGQRANQQQPRASQPTRGKNPTQGEKGKQGAPPKRGKKKKK